MTVNSRKLTSSCGAVPWSLSVRFRTASPRASHRAGAISRTVRTREPSTLTLTTTAHLAATSADVLIHLSRPRRGLQDFATANGTLTIQSATTLFVDDRICPASVTYNGSAQAPCSATVTGAGGLNQSLPVSYTANIDAGTVTRRPPRSRVTLPTPQAMARRCSRSSGHPRPLRSPAPADAMYNGGTKTPCTAAAVGEPVTKQPTLTVSIPATLRAGTVTASAAFDGDTNHVNSSGGATIRDSEGVVHDRYDLRRQPSSTTAALRHLAPQQRPAPAA